MLRSSSIRHLIMPVFILFVLNNLDAQIKCKLFYNDEWEITTEQDAKYYRECVYDTISSMFMGVYHDFTIDHIDIGTGRYENGEKAGYFRYNYDSGDLFCEGKFVKDFPDSIWSWYYSNGELWQKIQITQDEFDVLEYNDSNGKSNTEGGNFKWSMHIYLNPETENARMIGSYVEGKKDGNWQVIGDNEVLGYDVYKKGKYKKTKSDYLSITGWKWANSTYLIPSRTFATEQFYYTAETYRDAYPFLKMLPEWKPISGVGIIGDSMIFSNDINPEYPGGQVGLNKDIADNLIYPPSELRPNRGGSVIIEVIIDEEGKIQNTKVLKSPGDDFSKAALGVIGFLHDFKPAIYNGEPIKSRIILTITYNFMGTFKDFPPM